MLLTDKGDDILGILYANPEKVTRQLLKETNLKADIFPLDKAQRDMFAILVAASYTGRKANQKIIDAYCLKNKLSEDDRSNLDVCYTRIQEAESNFAYLKEAIELYMAELKATLMKKLLVETNNRLNEEAPIEDILVKHKEGLANILKEQLHTSSVSTKNYTSQFIAYYETSLDARAVKYMIGPMDEAVGDILPGELHVIAGASGEGKSIILANIIYNNVLIGKNFVLSSLEMSKEQYLMRIFSLHSANPKLGYNLDHEKIKQRKLNDDEKEKLYLTIQDFCETPEYGQIFFIENSGATTVDDIFDEAEEISRYITIHAVAIDYASLLAGQGSNERAVIANNFKLIKSKALTFNKGEKIPVITVHQINEQAKEKAEESGGYTFNFLADTTEVRKSSDVGFWILRTKAHRESKEIGCGVWKTRDSKGDIQFSLFEHFEFCKVEAIDQELE